MTPKELLKKSGQENARQEGKIIKVCFLAYEDQAKTEEAKGNSVFVVPLNPETYNLNLKVEYEKKKSKGSQGTNPKYTGTKPKELKMDFILDGTGTAEGYHSSLIGKTVPVQIEKLLAVVYSVNGNTHVPNRLKVNWGEELVFDCVMTDLSVNYTLFDRNGSPLRAKLSITFLGHKEPTIRVKETDNKSPDLTHVFVLGGEETLTRRTVDIYGGPEFYRQVAAANDLTSFRNVPEGTSIVYPPLDKSALK